MYLFICIINAYILCMRILKEICCSRFNMYWHFYTLFAYAVAYSIYFVVIVVYASRNKLLIGCCALAPAPSA